MLTHLSIHNFALIESLALDFSTGLIIFTGETGAGKSIIMDALSLTLGRRGETGFIREGTDRCEIAAVFEFTQPSAAYDWLAENALLQEQDCILRRIITRDGRSKSFINGRPVPLQLLRELGLLLVTLHGQHEHQQLLQPEGQRQLLDNTGQLQDLRRALSQRYQHYRDIKTQLEAKVAAHQQLLTQQDFLTFQAQELSALALQAGEVEALEKEQKRLSHGTQLAEGIQAIVFALSEADPSLISHLHTHTHKLTHLASFDDKLLELAKLLESATIQVNETASELTHFLDNVEGNPQRLEAIADRLSRCYELARKHHISPEELVTLEQSFSQKIASITADSDEITQLETQLDASLTQYHDAALALSKKRQDAAKHLNLRITSIIQKLGMKGGKFEVSVQPRTDTQPSLMGYDTIEFWVSTNPGSSMQPLTKIVSGGELSRLSLAISVVTVSERTNFTLVFDEIDSGIGGATAACVGELLKQLSQHHQILCITHAPQVATCSAQHFVVAKNPRKNSTQVVINALDEAQKVHEIARMLGGAEITQSTLAHAQEMLKVVQNELS